MRTIEYELDIGFCGCGDEGTIQVPDDMTNSEIDEMISNMAHEWADSWEGDSRLGFTEDANEATMEEESDSFRENVCGSWKFI
jgi:hypothetical protein